MALPHSFLAGEVARASEVNDNFNAIMEMLGQLSTSGRLQPEGEFLMGPRGNVLFTGAHDTGVIAREFYQIGWNADYNDMGGGVWKFARFISNRAATALRLGSNGFEVLVTSTTSGDLNAQMGIGIAVRANSVSPNADYVYIGEGWFLQRYDGVARNLEDYRLTFTPFDVPKTIYENQNINPSTVVKSASDYGVSQYAKRISITTYASGSGSTKFLQERNPRSNKYGFIVNAVGGYGEVNLGEGAYRGKFVIEHLGTFSSFSAYITGYWA